MNNQLQNEIRARIEHFAEDITELLRQAVSDAVGDALQGPRPTRGRKPGKLNKKGAAAKKVTTRGKKKVGRPAKKLGRKKTGRARRRSGAEIAGLGDKIVQEVKRGAGRRMEELAVALKAATPELRGPMKLLIEEGRIRTEGQRRGTKYYPG